MGNCFGKSAITVIEVEQVQSSPQHFFFLFFESAQDFLQHSFWQLDEHFD